MPLKTTKINGKSTVLLLINGYGVAEDGPANAWSSLNTPNLVSLKSDYPSILFGLTDNQSNLEDIPTTAFDYIFNSKKTLSQEEFLKLNIEDGIFDKNSKLTNFLKAAKKKNTKLHLIIAPDESGSIIMAAKTAIELMLRKNIENVFVHLIVDSKIDPKEFDSFLIGGVKLATLAGANYALDQTRDFTKIERYYEALTRGLGEEHTNLGEMITVAFTDLPPTIQVDHYGNPLAVIEDGDAVMLFSAAGRLSELAETFGNEDFDKFDRKKRPVGLKFLSLYDVAELNLSGLINQTKSINLFRATASAGKRNLLIVDSLSILNFKNIDLSDCQISLAGLTVDDNSIVPADEVIEAEIIEGLKIGFDFIVAVLNGPAIAASGGDINKIIEAVKKTDNLVGKIAKEVLGSNDSLIIAGTYGQAEAAINIITELPEKKPNFNPVEVILAQADLSGKSLFENGQKYDLKDFLPTIASLI